MNRRQVEELRKLQSDPHAEGASRLSKLIRGTRYTRASKIPDTDIEFVWRVLSGHDKQAVLGNSCKRFAELGIPVELRSYNDLEDEMTWQLIAMAMRDPDHKGTDTDPYPRPLATVDECRTKLTPDERDILISEYMDLEEEVDPDPMLAPEVWYTAVEDALKKKPEEAARALSNFGSRTLIGYLLTTASRQSSSPIGSSGSPEQSGESPGEEVNPSPEPDKPQRNV